MGGNGALAFLDENDEAIWFYSIGLLGGGVAHTIGALKSGISAKEIFFLDKPLKPERWEISSPSPVDELKKSWAKYPSITIRNYMEEQARLFEEKREILSKQYLGEYVLFENGEVIDHGKDKSTLVKKAYEKNGPKPLFITKVVKEAPESETWVPAPF